MNEQRMSKIPVIVDESGKVQKLHRIMLNSHSFKEEWMQTLLEKSPSILPTGNISSVYAPLVCLAREVETPSGYIDNLYISAKGYIVLVETKLWRNPEARREVVGQILDYAKDIQKWTYENVDAVYRKYHRTNESLFSRMVAENLCDAYDEAVFVDTVEKNLKASRFLLMIVGDGIREGVEKMSEFLNQNPTMQYHFALCELEVYELENGQRLVVPQLTAKTELVERGFIRIEGSGTVTPSIEMHTEEATESEHTITTEKKPYMSPDQWVDQAVFSDNNKAIMRELIDDFESLGYTVGAGTADLSVKIKFTQYKKAPTVLWGFGKGESFGIQPSMFYNFVKEYGFSTAIVDKLLDALKPYLYPNEKQKNIPYENEKGYYWLNPVAIFANKDEFLSIYEKFIANIQ